MGIKKSKYTISIPVDGVFLLFNSISNKIIKLDEYESVAWVLDIETIPTQTKEWLFKNHFLIDSTFDETTHLLKENSEILERIKNKQKRTRAHFRILTTNYCNANCEYCFEHNFSNRNTLSIDIAKQIITYITDMAKSQNKITLTWFGGEPLLNTQIITFIVTELKKSNPNKIISSTMLTNGSLFDDTNIEEASTIWNLTHVQITLDGLEERHNKIKNYRNSKYGFKQTIENIHKLIEKKIRVTIRINIDIESATDTLFLIDYLYKEFQNTVHVYCATLYSNGNYRVNTNKDAVKVIESIVFKKLYDYHYLNPQKILRRRYNTCGFATFDHHLVIDADGSVYKCCEAIGHPEISRLGTIWDKTLNQELISKWVSPTIRDECIQCNYLPICLGGCKCRDFNIDSPQCFRYKNIIDEIILWESKMKF